MALKRDLAGRQRHLKDKKIERRRNKVLEALADDEVMAMPSDELVADAERIILRTLELDDSPAIEYDDKLWIELLERQALRVSKLNDRQHLETIANAYACYLKLWANRSLKESLIAKVVRSGRKVDERHSPLRYILEQHIQYGDTAVAEDRRRAQINYSRDEYAIRTLLRRGIRPTEVVALAEKDGEGLDAWSREKAPEGVTAPKATKVGTTHDLVWTFGGKTQRSLQLRGPMARKKIELLFDALVEEAAVKAKET